MSEGTATLRRAAPRWSLAGDQQLLDLLQEIHQRIISKCNDTNKRLEEMSRGLRDASVNLQNVNNKFLALSNTQFVESRVYEDDADVAPPSVEKEPPKIKDLASDLTKLKQSLQILESYHEPLLIVGDSDSDSDEDDRLVLKPKDLYAERPLPYIIGSQAWKSKWHAGLVPDESDSDSSTSKVEDVEVYSDSEEERNEPENYPPARKMSTGSSSLRSENVVSVSPARPSPSAVAAELARRLGGDIKIPEREAAQAPDPVARKLYKPQEPLATTIFPEEPPPLDSSSSEEDIFAELQQPRRAAPGGLFDFTPQNPLEQALFGPTKVQTSNNTDKPPLFEDSEPEIEAPKVTVTEKTDDNVKKPVGGISLFGTNKHAESIGSAILNRNRRRSSTSGDESNTEDVKTVRETKTVEQVKEVKKERDIFDDLFAKSEKLNKKNAKIEVHAKETVKPKETKKSDVFSDIFDDIDDIFSSDIVNVQIKETKKNEKSLFSDDDDLFAEISKVKTDSNVSKVANSAHSDLFSDVAPKKEKIVSKETPDPLSDVITKVEETAINKDSKVIKEIKHTKSIFDSDSDDGLFVTKDVKQNNNKIEKPVEYKLKDDLFDDDEDSGLFAKNNATAKAKLEVNRNITKASDINKNALFDSDDELFKDANNIHEVKSQSTRQDKNEYKNDTNTNQFFDTPVNRIEKETDNSNKERDNSNQMVKTDNKRKYPGIDSINNDKLLPESPKQSEPEESYDSFDDDVSHVNKPEIGKKYEIESSAINVATEKVLPRNTQEKESSVKTSDVIFNKPDKDINFKENILRTTRIASDEDNITAVPEKRDIFSTDSDDDLFRSKSNTPKVNVNINQNDGISKTTVVPETPELNASSTDEHDIFSDIFDVVPPVFEKPKEPKKSKNVNALFDDDSDDEALFFKKNDIITDEKPEFSPSDERFGIFNDEPPAIDIDFTQKSVKSEEVVQRSQKTDSDNISPESVKSGINAETIDANIVTAVTRESLDATDNTSKEPKKVGKLKPMNFNINVNTLLPGASPKKKQVENTDEQSASNEELDKTEKIETKMVKSISFDDPEILDNKLSKERAKIQVKRRPSTRRARKEAVRKSAIDFTDSSFDSSNDNSVKDEVKPEKVVKTVYILNDDDIFGTAASNEKTTRTEPLKKHLNIVDSDDELFRSPNTNEDKNQTVLTKDNQATVDRKSSFDSVDSDDLFKKPASSHAAKDTVDADINVQTNMETVKESKTDNLYKTEKEAKTDISINAVQNKADNKSIVDSHESDDLFRQTKKPSSAVNSAANDSDEELFKNTPKIKNIDVSKDSKSFLNSDDDDELFKTKTSKEVPKLLKLNNSSDDENLFKSKGIGTLGEVYRDKNKQEVKETHTIFDDFPAKPNTDFNDDITQYKTDTINKTITENVKKVEKTVKRSILDDLSDEDDLFKSKTKFVNKREKSLFGDDGDEDNLFGSKPVKVIKQDIPVAPKEPTKEPKAAEPVFVDPLSLFDDDE